MNTRTNTLSRRRFLELTGTAAALIPLVNLTGCGAEEAEETPGEAAETGGGTPAPGTRPVPDEPQQTAPPADQPAEPPQGQAGQPAQTGQGNGDQGAASLVRLEESDPQAQALGYKHDAAEVDESAYPQYQQGQLCSNCNLYRPEQGEQPWGGCQIFPGKLVHADGWCAAYVPAQQT